METNAMLPINMTTLNECTTYGVTAEATTLGVVTVYGLNLPGDLVRTTTTLSGVKADMTIVHDSVLSEANERQLKLMMPSFLCICVLLTLGIPGNIFAIVMFLTKLKKVVARHLLMTLAISDLISCAIAMPSELDIMSRYFDFDEDAYCRIFRFVAYFTNNLSSLTLVAIAIERHRIICTPWKQKFTSRISRAICYINICLSVLSALPTAFIYGTQTIYLGEYPSNIPLNILQQYMLNKQENITMLDNSPVNTTMLDHSSESVIYNATQMFVPLYGKTCSINDSAIGTKFPVSVLITYIVTTLIVYVLLTTLYTKIGRSLFSRRRESIVLQHQERSLQRARQVTIMGFTLTLVYQICYLPCFILLVLNLLKPELYFQLSTSGKMVYIVLLKSYLINCTINPFIYCVFNTTVRQMLGNKCSKYRKASTGSTTSNKNTNSIAEILK